MAHVLRGPGMICDGCIGQVFCLPLCQIDAERMDGLHAVWRQFAKVGTELGETG